MGSLNNPPSVNEGAKTMGALGTQILSREEHGMGMLGNPIYYPENNLWNTTPSQILY
jgi:hypothetical protein